MRSVRFSPDRRIAPALVGVLLVHLALLIALLDGARLPQPDAAPTPRMTLRLVPTVLPPKPAPGTDAAPTQATPRTAAPARLRNAARPSMRDGHAPSDIAATAITAPEPTASGAETSPSLLDSEATRRAIRASARTPSFSDQLAQSREEPRRLSANDRLAGGVREAGNGDCMTGEYAGAGMGLLSLPFLAAAIAGGNCAQ